MASLIHVTDQNFEHAVLQSNIPVLVDFWAEWCGPCKMFSPILEEAANAYDGLMEVVKINIDDNPETPQKFHVRGIPTIALFKNGELASMKVGALTKSQLIEFLEATL